MQVIMLRTLKHIFVLAILLGGFALVTYYAESDQKGFISIDCGRPHISNYSEKTTGLVYISDTTLVDGGESKSVLPEYYKDSQEQLRYLRSFPQGIRNCYKISNIASGAKYLIRTSFLYGNYDGQNKLPEFNLHLGTDLWDRIKFVNATTNAEREIIHMPTRNYLEVCVEDTASGTPFISAIELRPLSKAIYQTAEGSLALVSRSDLGSTAANNTLYRWPDDVYDRIWRTYNRIEWTKLSSGTGNVDPSSNDYDLPSVVMNTAASPINQSDTLKYTLQPNDYNSKYYVYMHFAELVQNQSRQFRIYLNERLWWYNSTVQPLNYLETATVYSPQHLHPIADRYVFSISATTNSTLPPILNAIEIYMLKQFQQSQTEQIDVEALTNIKSTYRVTKNWQGDPCVPEKFLWEGVTCSYVDNSEEFKVISLNLSFSGLTGKIPPSISDLTKIQILDLSNNNFTGEVPEFLSRLPKLTVLHLDKNNFTGSLPIGLLQKWKDGLLSISMDGNIQHLCASSVSCKKKKKMNNFVVPVVATVLGIFVGLLTASAVWWSLKRKPRDATSTSKNGLLESVKRQFTYSEILKITNNFQKSLGKGGFGTVYCGKIGNAQVAVKMLSESSVQGYQEFLTEVQLLMRVHHRNLTSLVGYCNAKTNVGLIYEYMAKGNLQEALSGKSSEPLNWEDRLRITMDAAQGLEYLHYGCRPPIVHRDVKTTNILLNQYMQAKLSDFGLSKAFPSTDPGTDHITTRVAGTLGYLDPEYYRTYRLNEKSDVYSFGVVMLEIITGRPAVLHESQEKIHIGDWVSFMLEKGDMTSIVDPRLEGNFDTNCAWKAVEIAIKCISPRSIQRPTMNQVVVELKECLVTGKNSAHTYNPTNPTNEINPLYSITEMSAPSAR